MIIAELTTISRQIQHTNVLNILYIGVTLACTKELLSSYIKRNVYMSQIKMALPEVEGTLNLA